MNRTPSQSSRHSALVHPYARPTSALSGHDRPSSANSASGRTHSRSSSVNSVPGAGVTMSVSLDVLWVDETAAGLQLSNDDTDAAHAFAKARDFILL